MINLWFIICYDYFVFEESEDDGENEVDADQIMGEIDDSEENQLDPGLWDNEQNDESFETSVEEQAGYQLF